MREAWQKCSDYQEARELELPVILLIVLSGQVIFINLSETSLLAFRLLVGFASYVLSNIKLSFYKFQVTLVVRQEKLRMCIIFNV